MNTCRPGNLQSTSTLSVLVNTVLTLILLCFRDVWPWNVINFLQIYLRVGEALQIKVASMLYKCCLPWLLLDSCSIARRMTGSFDYQFTMSHLSVTFDGLELCQKKKYTVQITIRMHNTVFCTVFFYENKHLLIY